jgi:RNA polymerase sigma-70 factor (ECF subfamily)
VSAVYEAAVDDTGTVDPDVAAARRGDRAAWRRLHQRFARLVHGALLSRVSKQDADDLIQDVFVTALQKLGSLRDDGAFGGWLLQIARARAADLHRRARPASELSDGLPGTSASAADRVEALEVLRAIRSLPEAYRETLALRLVEGMSGPEIAEQTGLTPASVRVNLHRGMLLLKEKLNAGT